MEKIIVQTKINTIGTAEVEELLENSGVIFVYNKKEKLIGSVIGFNQIFILRTLEVDVEFESLEEILSIFPNYIFKYCV